MTNPVAPPSPGTSNRILFFQLLQQSNEAYPLSLQPRLENQSSSPVTVVETTEPDPVETVEPRTPLRYAAPDLGYYPYRSSNSCGPLGDQPSSTHKSDQLGYQLCIPTSATLWQIEPKLSLSVTKISE